MNQETTEYTDGNYINMQIEEELHYDRKDEAAYLKFPGDDDLENTTLVSKRKTNKKQKSKRKEKKRRSKTKSKSKSRIKSVAPLSANLQR